MKTQYVKVRFTSRQYGPTAGLILLAAKLQAMSVSDVSRLFPYSEASKMSRLEVSPRFDSWNEAFAHDFDSKPFGRLVSLNPA